MNFLLSFSWNVQLAGNCSSLWDRCISASTGFENGVCSPAVLQNDRTNCQIPVETMRFAHACPCKSTDLSISILPQFRRAVASAAKRGTEAVTTVLSMASHLPPKPPLWRDSFTGRRQSGWDGWSRCVSNHWFLPNSLRLIRKSHDWITREIHGQLELPHARFLAQAKASCCKKSRQILRTTKKR